MNIADYNREFCRDSKALNYERFRVWYYNGSRACFKIFNSLKEANEYYKLKKLISRDIYLDDILMNITIKHSF